MVFGIGKPKRKGRPLSKPKTLKEILNSAYTKALKSDPELMREIAFKEAGHEDLLHKDRETEKKKRAIKDYVINAALEQIKADPELSAQFVESQVEEILSNGAPKQPTRRGRRGKDEYEYGSSSPLSSALEGLESIGELKAKLVELGLVKEDDGNSSGGGFLKGMTLKDIMGALPAIQTLLGNGGNPKTVKVYVVPINGRLVEVNESQYIDMVRSGQVQLPSTKPAQIESSKTEQTKTELAGTDLKAPATPALPDSSVCELPTFLQNINFEAVETWLDQKPEDFVTNLKADSKGQDEAKFVWGFLTTATYDGIVEKITPYRTHPKVSALVEKVLSDSGKLWTMTVLELVSGFEIK